MQSSLQTKFSTRAQVKLATFQKFPARPTKWGKMRVRTTPQVGAKWGFGRLRKRLTDYAKFCQFCNSRFSPNLAITG